MPDLVSLLPVRRPELLLRPLGGQGQYVVKDPRTGEFFHLGEKEHFLLAHFDGTGTAEAVCAAYAERFGEPLSVDDLDEFIELARSQHFLQAEGGASPAAAGARQSVLSWRKSLWDPDRLFTWLAPRLWFFWT